MSRRKVTPLNPWETLEPGGRSHYHRIARDLMQCEKFKELGYSARYLYICMVEACAGKRQFRFTHRDYVAFGIEEKTFFRAREELIQAGFLRLTESGRSTRTPNLYEWRLDWKT